MVKGHVVWVQIYSVPEWWKHQGKKSGRWNDELIVPCAYHTCLWGQCVMIWVVSVDILNDQVFPSIDFFLPWWHGHISRWQYHNLSGSNCFWGAWHVILSHGLATTVARSEPHWLVFGTCWRRLYTAARLSHHQYNHWWWSRWCWKMNSALDKNRCCDIA